MTLRETVRRVECDLMTGPVNSRVMLLEPRDSKDNGVAVEDCQIEGQVFVVLLNLKLHQVLA